MKRMVRVRSLGELRVGDVVRHRHGAGACVVTAHYGECVAAVQRIDISNPDEWLVLREVEPT